MKKYVSSFAVILSFIVLLVTACSSQMTSTNSSSSSSASSSPSTTSSADSTAKQLAPGQGGTAIGFVFVGARDDYGYNQAAYQGSVAVEKAFPNMKILRAENVPETADVERVMEDMIHKGAKIIFPTSYGYLDYALDLAKRYPDVVFFHQGGLQNASNVGTYFGTIWQPVYLAGVAAGKMTKTNKLGFIASVPIPQVLLNINAFTLGAQSVNPKITTTTVFTGSWCDPGKQADAANSLIDKGVDVLTQHQDCTKTIIETAERRGIMSVGYHADASSLAPKGWIVGSVWNWPKLYVDMTKTVLDGKFVGSPYDGKYRGSLKDGIVQLTGFGSAVPDDVQTLVLQKEKDMIDGKFNPFVGPITDQQGKVEIKQGENPNVDQLESTNYLINGVIGNIPKQ